MSYHAASGNIALGRGEGQVELWQYLSEDALLQARLPSHTCARERLTAADKQVKLFEASLDKIDDGLRQRISRETELKSSISELEIKCTRCRPLDCILNMSSGERQTGIRRTADSRVA